MKSMQLYPSPSTAEVSAAVPDSPGPGRLGRRSRLHQRLAWSGAIVTVLLLLVFIPPLVNANRYQRQIARSMSASLGRPVHLDNATLHLLPVPGLTLSNLVVSEDPAFGDEPTIRANSVEATLRLGSLWRRRVEFSTVRFIEPSVNLVRNPQGRWNLADVLLHASHVETAPTVQVHAGPAPRFPYIEATGGRVNLKLGAEKLPFSLTDADFALWLPSPNQWKVRLQGQPARTDANLNDPGTLRIEGGLQRAEIATGIPVNLEASWHDAPLGEASRLVTGDDMGWRGTVNLDATLAGTLSQATFALKATLGDVRRAEFAAVHPLDLQIACDSGISAATAVLRGLTCTLPDSAATPLRLQADRLDLNHVGQTAATVEAEDVPLHWSLLWAALFSARVPTDTYPAARMTVHLQHGDRPVPSTQVIASARLHRGRMQTPHLVSTASSGGWFGEVLVHLPPAPGAGPGESLTTSPAAAGTVLVWRPAMLAVPPAPPPVSSLAVPGSTSASAEAGLGFVMGPAVFSLAPGTSLTVNASVGPAGYTASANGTASTVALLLPARYLPQLADGMDTILPSSPTDLGTARVDFTCTHPWGAAQSCTSLRPTVPLGRPLSRPVVDLGQGVPAVQLAPRSLSPFDRDPRLGGAPAEPGTSSGAPSQPQTYTPRTLPHL